MGRASPQVSALIGGAAAHALSFDDVTVSVTRHPSATLVPALCAAPQMEPVPGRNLLIAYLVGLEVGSRLGQHFGPSMEAVGFHSTTVLGVTGAAVAVGHLMGLNEEQVVSAIGIAASSAAGQRRNFGTMTRPLQVGMAAENGLRAALLARAGIAASPDSPGDQGLFGAFSGMRVRAPERLHLGEPLDVVASGTAIKRYPCAYPAQRIIDLMLDLSDRHGLVPDRIASIFIQTPPGALDLLTEPLPGSGGPPFRR